MTVSVTRTATFAASHQLDGDPDCGNKVHGHTWTISVTVTHRDVDPRTGHIVIDPATAVREVAYEFHNRHINDMLPSLPPTAENLATYITERLRLPLTGLSGTKIDMGGIYTATVVI